MSAPSSDVSSPALPELSLDASLQRLHQQEDISASSLSSAARSRAWLQSHYQGSSEHEPSLPIESSPPVTESGNLDHSEAFRFPPLKPPQSATAPAATGLVGHQATQPQEPPLPARPRTSRGLSYRKPFLSSSHATFIASLAEHNVEPTQQFVPQVGFGTPFATGAFQTNLQDSNPVSSSPRADSNSSGSSIEELMQEFPTPSLKQTRTNIETRPDRVETRRLHASPLPKYPSLPSSWTLLFVPWEQPQSFGERILPESTRNSILLPLLSSFEDQVEQLKVQLVQDLHHERRVIKGRDVELLLDLSSISSLPAKTLARLTPQSWPVMFEAYLLRGRAKDGAPLPLPYLYRKTGFPIAALVRYRLTTSSAFAQTFPRADASLSRAWEAQKEHRNHDSSPWARRESEMTLLPAHFSKSGPSLTMTASRSFPGAPRTPNRRSPLPYSPRRSAFPGDASQHQAFEHTPFKPASSPLSHSLSEGSKLRALSLAAVHPLSPVRNSQTPMDHTEQGTTAHSAKRYVLDAESSQDTTNAEHTGTCASSLSCPRQRQRSSRGSSHKSFPSNTTTLSSRSTRNTSIHSSHTHLHAVFDREGSDSDDDDSDDDLGSRFWTQLSSLGEQVFRESKQSGDNAGQNRRSEHDERSVSISSTASDASVFDFSPLGILVPTDGPLETGMQSEEKTGTKRVSILPVSQGASSSSLSPIVGTSSSSILGRRRAYNSMVPLARWRAGDSDPRTAEGQRYFSSDELPQVLVLESRDGIVSNTIGRDHPDSVTPTAASFQGWTRVLSVQPFALTPFGSVDTRAISQKPESRTNRQNVWDEAMLQLTERLIRSNVQSAMSRQASLERSRYWSKTSSETETRASLYSGALAISSPLQPQEHHDSDAGPSDVHSSPLPGLFYEKWVEQVDGGVDGELGRRGSTFESLTEPAEASAGAASSTSKIDAGNPGALGLASSTTSNLVESDENEPLLQDLQESNWPRPQPRYRPPVSDTRSLLSASTSASSRLLRPW
ncbi:uncharacterized protein SPSC_01150 [Sporisorium scitamineum]|uniref:Uncharacterized protein n=1 Tax=Sporisorium scitamineum TaxID=49012 RepID=A0A127Z8S4_9BASI|nr:uncharacterized protein SPSC_01150 [Sporisorium scitamineum]